MNFGTVAVGLSQEYGINITVTENNTTVTISSMTLNGANFQFAAGVFPYTLAAKNASFSYSFNFVPTSAQLYTGSATFIINNEPVVVSLTGTGIITTAVATPSVSNLSFSGALGSKSPAQNVKITNTGTSTVTILTVTAQQPFTTRGLPKRTPLVPGASVSVSVNYFGSIEGTATGSLLFTYDVLPATGIDLYGTTILPTKFAMTNNPTLPLGTAGFAYLAQMDTVEGTAPVSFSLAGGALPPGLTLSSTGAITGTISSTATLQTYTFTVDAADSASHTTSSALSLEVLAPTGAKCNDISWDVAGTANLLIPITDLGTGNYFGTEGGLYGGGSNMDPAQHQADGVSMAQQVQPLDTNGNPSPSGKIGVVGFGISTLLYEMNAFTPLANGDAAKNPSVVVINGGEATAGAPEFADLTSGFWTTLVQNIVPNAGVSPEQVQVAFFEDIVQAPTGTYPSDQTVLISELEEVAQNALIMFPNLKLMYYVSRIYSGYSTTNVDPEPYAYEQGLANSAAILDQIQGDPAINYNPLNGPVLAPWMGYGPYTWANGYIPRSDGLTYSCQDLRSDGHHPSALYGAPKVAGLFLNFFKTEPTTTPWFLAPPAKKAK